MLAENASADRRVDTAYITALTLYVIRNVLLQEAAMGLKAISRNRKRRQGTALNGAGGGVGAGAGAGAGGSAVDTVVGRESASFGRLQANHKCSELLWFAQDHARTYLVDKVIVKRVHP
jgi:hypothetical protein